MKFRKTGALLIAAVFLLNMAPLPAHADAKRRIAIMPFDSGSYASAIANVDLGSAIASMLTTKLVNDGTYRLIDRQMLDSVMKEQNLSVSDRADPATACKIGKILSVDAIVVGSITQFGQENKSSSASLPTGYIPGIPYVGGFGGFGSFRSSKSKTKVSIDAKVIDINTTEILAAMQGTGEASRKGGGIGGFSSDTYGESAIADEATIQAVDSLSGQIVTASAKIPDNQSLIAKNVEGKIADITGNTATVNVGKKSGVQVGSKLNVQRSVKKITDPDSGKIIKEVFSTIATITIKEADDTSASGDISGTGVKVGDSVKVSSTSVTGVVLEK
ncbi:MAG: CsgG/HfaB family protein [Candidatus Melainabacteria bacterium]|nr:CsgG/HfaB family protein [Candidatus Melainabacteria bacterium]